MTDMEQLGSTFLSAIALPLQALGIDAPGSAAVLKKYAAESMARLATMVGQPGFEMALEAERDIVAIKAGLRISKDADNADLRFLGVVEGALRMGAGLLTGGAV